MDTSFFGGFFWFFFGLFLLHWRYELPYQDKLPEFQYTPILGCIRVLWLVFHPLGLGLDKALFWLEFCQKLDEDQETLADNINFM